MSPKGQKKNPRDMGGVHLEGNFWLASARIDGRTIRGPPRLERGEADADLASAQKASTQAEMQHILLQQPTPSSVPGVQALPDSSPEAHGEAAGGALESIEEVAEKATCAQGAAAALT